MLSNWYVDIEWFINNEELYTMIDLGKVTSCYQVSSLTPLQNKTLEVATNVNKDIVIQAPNYSGKTLAYLVPTFDIVTKAIREERWKERPGFRALIIVPTREAAISVGMQIDKYISSLPESERPLAPIQKGTTETYTRKSTKKEGHEEMDNSEGYELYDKSITRRENVYGISYAITCGGKSFESEINMLDSSEPEIIVATPGRLVDHLKNSDYFRNVKIVIVDDCSSFVGDVSKTMDQIFTPENIPQTAKRLFVNDTNSTFRKYLRNSDEVETITQEEPILKTSSVNQSVIKTKDTTETLKVLYQILSENKNKKVMVFGEASKVIQAHYLMAENNLFSVLISSKTSGTRAMTNFSYFNQQSNGIAFCSSIAYPLNPDADLVIHLDAPLTQEKYDLAVSRALGKSGSSKSIVLTSEIPTYLKAETVSAPAITTEFSVKPLRVATIQQENGLALLFTLLLRTGHGSTDAQQKKVIVQKALSELNQYGFSDSLLPKMPKKLAIKIGYEQELLEAGLLEL